MLKMTKIGKRKMSRKLERDGRVKSHSDRKIVDSDGAASTKSRFEYYRGSEITWMTAFVLLAQLYVLMWICVYLQLKSIKKYHYYDSIGCFGSLVSSLKLVYKS